MYEDLMQRLRKWSDEYEEFAGERHQLMDEAADAIEDLQRQIAEGPQERA